MGCCVSTPNVKPPPPPSPATRSPPPPYLEEETVKEVLSETPTLPKPSVPKIIDDDDEKIKNTPRSVLLRIDEEDDHNAQKKRPLVVSAIEEISEVSEICSLSESVSTTTVNERRDDEFGEVRQRVVDRSPAKMRNRSFSGEFSAKRERVAGKSPARRADPSPGRVRVVPGREKRDGVMADGKRQDAGESSGRRSRSRSPGNRSGVQRSDMGRSPSSRRNGKSPGRVQPEKTRNWPPPTTTDESLENPLVSLECFIFL